MVWREAHKQRDLQAMTMRASHVIFMGYSLPLEDVTYRAFFSARSQRNAPESVYCTVVNKDDANPGWYGPDELGTRSLNKASDNTVSAAREVFGKEKVRFFGGGIPDVFLDDGLATAARLEKLLHWSL